MDYIDKWKKFLVSSNEERQRQWDAMAAQAKLDVERAKLKGWIIGPMA